MPDKYTMLYNTCRA